MNFLDKIIATAKPVEDLLFSPGSVFSLYSLAAALLLAFGFLALRQKRRRGRVRLRAIARAIFARRVFFHRSTFADLGYCLIGVMTLGTLFGWAILSASAIADFIAKILADCLGTHEPLHMPALALRVAITAILFIGYELGYFLDHCLKHRIPMLWELHKTHHTAEVLTPLTNFRVHPLDSLIFANVLALVIGLFGGLAKYIIGQPVQIFAVDGTNILMIIYIYVTAHLQHSQIWIPLRGPLGRFFMSPAHHQIHHSSDAAHYNKNMGASLAVWDWLFGTLEMPQASAPALKFGVVMNGDEAGDPHSVAALLLNPVLNALRALRSSQTTAASTGGPAEIGPPAR